MNLYSIYDLTMAQYLAPFVAHNNGHALRMFSDHVNEPGTPVNKHPDDYTMDHIGEFNENTGELTGSPVRIARAIDFYNAAAPRPLDITEAVRRKKETA